jgi:hypothetical protein
MKANHSRLGAALLIGTGVILLGGGAWVGLQLRYVATATVKIAGYSWREKEFPINIKAELKAAESSIESIVQTLDLTTEWGMADSAAATARLRRNLRLHPVVNTSLIEIRVTSQSPDEAARIANALANALQERPHVTVVNLAAASLDRDVTDLASGLSLAGLGLTLLVCGLLTRSIPHH